MDDKEDQKEHHKRRTGAKAKKKQVKNDPKLTPLQRNPKAFSYQSVNKVSRVVRRYLLCITHNRINGH